ncbi:lipid-A-disaccharide synthase [Litorimonas sp.]|uniref:lipid-A-disaccharide synthase n=1 Tax=Litorimonas sp. TaxID=1892381 RepID=UPI003A886751
MAELFIVAAERSGDELGAALIRDLKIFDESISIEGIGGESMALAGTPSLMDITGLNILGFVEALKNYSLVRRKVRECVDIILQTSPDAVILIDSWGFMVRVAQRLKAAGFKGKVMKYVAPQVWAMRSGRSKTLAQSVDLLLSIQPMDAPYFEQHGLETIYVGNPVFDADFSKSQGAAVEMKHDLQNRPLLSVWFGSRPSEIATLAEDFKKTVLSLKQTFPDLVVCIPVVETIKAQLEPNLAELEPLKDVHIVGETDKLAVMAASTAALACSGTVTSQLAGFGVPTVVAYRVNTITYFLAKRIFRPDHISIVNIAADRELMPEFIQDDVSPPILAKAVSQYLDSAKARDFASQALLAQTRLMGAGTGQKASEKAAQAILAAL